MQDLTLSSVFLWVKGNLLDNDTDPSALPLVAELVKGPSNDQLVLNADGSFTYTPDANFSGTDKFAYRASNGSGKSEVAEVRISVAAVNDKPRAKDSTVNVKKDGSVKIDLRKLVSDVDDDAGSLAISIKQPSHGKLVRNADGTFTYTPDKKYTGEDSFTYTVSDGVTNDTARVKLVVKAGGNPQARIVVQSAQPVTQQLQAAPVVDWSVGSNTLGSTGKTEKDDDNWLVDFLAADSAGKDLAKATGLTVTL